MGRAALAFAAGLGKGYIDESQYQDKKDLLDREIALREADAQTRRELADQQLKQYRDADALKKSLAEATKKAEVKQSTTLDTGDGAKVYDMPAGVDSQDVAASDARQFRRNTEKTTGQPAPMPAIESRTSVNGKAYDTHAAGLKAAQEYDDPAARSLRIASALDAAGRPDAAMEFKERAEKHRQAMYDAGRQVIYQRGADMIASGDVQGLLDMYNQHYNDGRAARLSDDGKSIIQMDKDGRQTGALPFKDASDLQQQFYRLVYADKAAESDAAARARADEAARKPFKLAPGEKLMNMLGQTGASNDRLTSAESRLGAATAGGAGRNASVTTDADVGKALEAVYKGSDMKSASPELSAAINTLAYSIHRANGGSVPAQLAVQAAIAVAQKPESEQPAINLDTGTIDMAVQTNMGPVITRPNHSAGLSADKLRELVSGLQKRMPPGEFEALRDIAFDKSGQSFRRYLDGRARLYREEVAKNPLYSSLPTAAIEDAIARKVKDDQVVQHRLANLMAEYATNLGAGLAFDANGIRVPQPINGSAPRQPADRQQPRGNPVAEWRLGRAINEVK